MNFWDFLRFFKIFGFFDQVWKYLDFFGVFMDFLDSLDFFLDFLDFFWIFFGFFWIFQIFWCLWIFLIFRFFWIFSFFWFLSKLLRLLLNVTTVTTEHQKTPKLGQNSIKSPFFARRAKKASAKGWSPPQELKVGPRSGPYLLVGIKLLSLCELPWYPTFTRLFFVWCLSTNPAVHVVYGMPRWLIGVCISPSWGMRHPLDHPALSSVIHSGHGNHAGWRDPSAENISGNENTETNLLRGKYLYWFVLKKSVNQTGSFSFVATL